MTELEPPSNRPIPTHRRRLRDLEDESQDYSAPLAAVAAIVAVLGMTCLPVTAAVATAQARIQAPGTTLPAAAIDGPTAITLIGVLVFFLIGVVGVIGGIATMLRRNWGRRMLIGYAALVLLYLVAFIYLRFRYGISGLVNTAPTRSALIMQFVCVGGVFIVVAVLMLAVLRYFTLPHVARRFAR